MAPTQGIRVGAKQIERARRGHLFDFYSSSLLPSSDLSIQLTKN